MSIHPRHSRDWYRILTIIGIIIGFLLVVGAAVFWAVTGRESSLIVGSGMTLAIGGGLRNVLAGIADHLPQYEPPSPPPPPVPPTPTPTDPSNENST